jgi:U3 small nucleolar RNA-associated protein 7
MSHEMPGRMLSSLYFAPFDDVLGIGHDQGFSSILVPGAGQADIDTFEINPFETTRQRQESEVKMLLDKVRHETRSTNESFTSPL